MTRPNGRETLAAVAGSDYDLVLVDIQMPVMDGLEATMAYAKLRKTNLDANLSLR